ncbi:fructosamine kinase family protein [Aerococcus tenax]|uniref:fructosamine kinase family protein n=1 Tax=Aerococcus tenax TaxID=3078812 RepID=UPI001E58A375|nr:fructosamine kinase family protein [Aerococcus tenax]
MTKINRQWISQLPVKDIQKLQPVSGGDVNDAYRIDSNNGPYFLLVQKNTPASFYDSEVAGLKAFEKAGITAPKVISQGEINGDAYLLLTYLDEGFSGDQKRLGELISNLHHVHSDNGQFGFDLDYQGASLTFSNAWSSSWPDFFIKQRLDPLHNYLMDHQLWQQAESDAYQEIRAIIIDSLSQHKSHPSLLHGDLWSGIFMFLSDGRPAIFDPAPFYGDREFDIGVSMVFGGFNHDFYQSYQVHYPMAEGYEFRLEFYQLYLLMLHLAKFGTVYYDSVEATMRRIKVKAK